MEQNEGISIETLLNKSGNSLYKLVVITAKRALDLAEGKPKLIPQGSMATTKPSTLALMEVAAGKVHLKL